MTFAFVTYGCQMNVRDSEAVAALLRSAGYAQVETEAEADIVIVNTCSVRGKAEAKALGKLGLLVAQALALTGCELTAICRHQEKLAILAARGIHTKIGDEAQAACADLVIECTGQPEGFQEARRVLRPRGTLVLKSTYHGLVQADLSRIVVDEVRVVGSRCGPLTAALRLLAQDLVDVTSMIEAEYPMDEALVAIEHAGQRGALKVLVRP